MKNIKILICLICVLFITGCREENKLVTYLKKDDFQCAKNICVKEADSTDAVKTTTVYDIDNNNLKIDINYSEVQSSSLEYNWKTKKINYDYRILNDSFKTTYDLESYEYTCESDIEDKVYKKAECNILRDDIQKVIDNFNDVIKESKYEVK